MFNYKRGVSKVGGFALSAMLSGAANVVTIPFVVGAVGPTAWGAIATGQAAGAIGAVLVQMGWGVSGPAQVAKARTSEERLTIYKESLYFRLLILLPVAMIVFAVSWFVVPAEFAVASAIAGVGSALFGLSASWFIVGRSEPFKLIVLDTLPRAVVVVVGAVVVTYSQSPLVFSAFIVASSLFPFFLCTYVILTGADARALPVRCPQERRYLRAIIGEQWPGVTTSLIASSYKYLPLLCISMLAPGYAPAYAVVDRVLKFAIAGVRPLSQALQGWVPKGSPSALAGRISVAYKVALVVGAGAGLGFVAIGPYLTHLVGDGQISLGVDIIVPASFALAFGTVAQTTGLACLMARGQAKTVAFSAGVGAGICLIIIWPAVISMGAVGAMWCVALAEAGVLLVQTVALFRKR